MKFPRRQNGQSIWQFFILNLKSPVDQCLRAQHHDFLNGLITLMIYVFLTSIGAFLHSSAYGSLVRSFAYSFLFPFLSTALFLFLFIGVLFLIARLMGSKIEFTEVGARFGGLMVIPVLLNILSFIITLFNLEASLFYYFISLLAMISFFTAIIITVHSFRESRGLDPFYGVLLTFIAVGLMLLIFKDAIFQGMFLFLE